MREYKTLADVMNETIERLKKQQAGEIKPKGTPACKTPEDRFYLAVELHKFVQNEVAKAIFNVDGYWFRYEMAKNALKEKYGWIEEPGAYDAAITWIQDYLDEYERLSKNDGTATDVQ